VRRLAWTLLAPLLLAAGVAHGQAWPSKPIRIIYPFPSGGGGETLTRLVGQRFTEAWGQPVVVEAKPGASGMIGADLLVKAPADGYTLMYFPAALVVNPALYPKVPYDLEKDFTHLTLLGTFPLVLVVNAALPVKSVADLIQHAKSNPGRVNFASIGNASPPHLAGEFFKQLAGVDIVHVPYKGSAPAQVDLFGGQTQMMFDTAISAMPHVKAGRVRAIAVTTRNRSPLVPELPTLAESGLKDFDLAGWAGLAAPAGLPREIALKIQQEVANAFRQPDIAQKTAGLGAEAGGNSAEQYRAFVATETAKWRKLVQTSGAKLD
jgi:tripartite-type tricarboxylate transporter receptor subunit TctC